jgi:hypothetical protein
VRARVVSRHLRGESKREIARAEGIGRDTVGRILSQQEVVQMIARYQSRLLEMVPKAIGVYDEALESDDLHLATATATKLLEGMHVLSKGGIEETLNLAHKASPEMEEKDRTLRIIAQIINGSLEKSKIFGHPLTPAPQYIIDEELARRMEQERR